jgi:IS30 family transposase
MMPEKTPGYARLGFDERCGIQELLNAGASVSEVAAELGRSVSTITREIVRNRRDDGYRASPTRIVRLCRHVKNCNVRGLCSSCGSKRCAGCHKVRCTNICKRYEPDVCTSNTHAPYCCNGCRSRCGCWLHRYHYDAKLAQQLCNSRLSESRSGIDITREGFESMIEKVRPLIKKHGQSIGHVWATHGSEFPCSERTFYRYVDAGIGGLRNLDLVAKCRYRPRKEPRPSTFHVPEGRSWSDFCSLPEEDRLSVVEIDCVEGTAGDEHVLLTMLLKRISFLFVFVLEEHTQACVREVFDSLHGLLGDGFTKTFPLLLTDCGHEFQGFKEIEADGRTRVFYCEPRRADQKGSIENCHRLLRRIVPKKTSIDRLTPLHAALIASHVNSMPRPALGGATPFDLAHHIVPSVLLEGLGLEHIAPDDVVLKPSLLTD